MQTHATVLDMCVCYRCTEKAEKDELGTQGGGHQGWIANTHVEAEMQRRNSHTRARTHTQQKNPLTCVLCVLKINQHQ